MLLLGCTLCGADNIKGKVTADGKPLEGVLVSDGVQIVKTGKNGRYSIDSEKKDSTVFVIVPSGYAPLSKDGIKPEFWALLTKPASKTEKHDFRLTKQDQSNYTALFLTDFHLINELEYGDLKRSVDEVIPAFCNAASEAEKNGPVYFFNIGDFAMDKYFYENDFNLFDAYRFLVENNWPKHLMYSVSGNHDNDGGVQTGENNDKSCAWQYRRTFGPDRYAVNIGKDHWVLLDDIVYLNELPALKEEGIKGKRNYLKTLTDEQLEWLEEDLKYVPDDYRVKIVMHVPAFYPTRNHAVNLDCKILDRLDAMCSRWEQVEIYSGHMHQNGNCSSDLYPRFMQYCFAATSGAIWKFAPGYPLMGLDGGDASVISCQYNSNGTHDMKYLSYAHGEKYFRAYDMNSVIDAYKADKRIARQQKLYPLRIDYGSRQYRNYVYVNYWAWVPGDSVEMYENGKSLDVIACTDEDPLVNFAYYLPRFDGKGMPKFNEGHAHRYCNNMFAAKASKAGSDVLIIIKDKGGKVKHTETLHRPKAFTANMD